MSWGRYLKLAGILFVGSLLTLVEGLAQQGQLMTHMVANGNHQRETPDQPQDLSRSNDGAGAKVEATRNTDGVAAGGTEPRRETVEPAKPEPMPEALFLPGANQLSPLDKAYLDAFSILRQDNTCSRFYGGPRVIEVLNELKKQLTTTSIDKNIAVRMSGPTTSVTSHASGFSYRLFAKAELNLKGSFYHGNTSPNEETVPRIARFSPNTREARVTILLHELGHLVQKANKLWLLPNDGNNESVSNKNTWQVIAVCGDQIRQLHSTSFESELQAARSGSADSALRATVQP